jgi:hypothetical protein
MEDDESFLLLLFLDIDPLDDDMVSKRRVVEIVIGVCGGVAEAGAGSFQ